MTETEQKMNFKITRSDMEMATSFYYKPVDTFVIAVAELSMMMPDIIKDIYPQSSKRKSWMFFSRLLVPRAIRNQGVATALMDEVVAWADEKNIGIYNGVNPYDGSDLDRLINFYERYGFIEVSPKEMIRV